MKMAALRFYSVNFLYVFLSTLFFNNVLGQTPAIVNDPIIEKMVSPYSSFESIQNDGNEFYTPLRSSDGSLTKEEKIFRRWEYFTQSRCMYPGAPKGGSVKGADEYMKSLNNFNVCNDGFSSSPWSFQGPNPTPSSRQNIGIVISLAVDPTNQNIIYAGSNTSGIWKTTNGGDSWVNITDDLGIAGLGIHSIAIDPNNTNIILAGTGTKSYGWSFVNHMGLGVIRSTNGGDSWSIATFSGSPTFPSDFLNIEVIKHVPSNSNIVYAAGNKKIYKSIDGGLTWVLKFTNPTLVNVEFNDLEIDILNNNIIYASTKFSGDGLTAIHGSQFFVSTNAGNSWLEKTPPNTISTGVSVASAISIDVTPADASNVYLLYDNGNQHYVVKSNNNGSSWNLINQSSNITLWRYWCNEFEVSNTNSSVFYAGGGTVFKSTNSGASWTSISQYTPQDPAINSTHADIRALVQLPSITGDLLFMGNDGGVAKTTNGGSLWQNLNGDGLNITQFYSFGSFNTNNYLVGGTQDNGTRFKNGPTNYWTPPVLGGDGGWTEVDYTNDNIVFASIYDAICKSSNGGGGPYPGISNPGASGVLWRRFHLDPSNHNLLWWGAKDLYVYSPIPNSNPTIYSWSPKYTPPSTWTDIDGNTRNVGSISAINVAPSNGNIVYLAYLGPTWGLERKYKLLKSTDGGSNWTDLSANFTPYNWTYITDFEVDPYNPDRVWASCAGYWQGVPTSQGLTRVVFSNNGGTSWTDFSTGLPPFPVNCLVYRNGTDDEIYAGTDAGVYRWNKALQTWECFNNGLPAAIITKLEINNCKGKLLASTYGRGIWDAPLPQSTDYHVTTSQTWDENYYRSFNSNVVVDPGVTLTIKGTVQFAEDIRLIIKPNARVVVDGGILTNSCGGMWEGVNVGGNGNQPQTILSNGLSPYQGIIDLKNNATIQNAKNGISTSLIDVNGNINWTSFGGVIRAKDSKFINNRRDVEFMSYPNFNNVSYFYNCVFEINQLLVNGLIPTTRISMWNIKNVNIKGCDFKYLAGNAYPVLSRGNGIYSVDAKFIVNDYCTNGTVPCLPNNIIQSKFQNWDYGIESHNSNVFMSANINHVKFINNTSGGALLSGMHYPVFNNCEVEVGGEYQAYGLYLDRCKYYKVQNNSFNNTTNNQDDIGIFVRNSMEGAHQIYSNYFTNMTVGINSLDNNSGENNFIDGLKMNCNIFLSGKYDIAQMSSGNIQPTVNYVQGSSGAVTNYVRNYYSAICGNENKWYINNDNSFPSPNAGKQVIHHSYTGEHYSPLPQPSCSDLLVQIFSYDGKPDPSDCPLTMNKSLVEIKLEKSTLKLELANQKTYYDSIVDGGNTANLISSISSTLSSESLKNLLMSYSPFLSDDVLIAYINRVQTTPSVDIKDVIIANSPITNNVKLAIENKNLSQTLIEQINASQTGLSARFELEGQIILKNFEIQSLVSEEISNYLHDTSNVNAIDSILYLIKMENRPNSSCDLVKVNIFKGDYIEADQILDTLELKPHLSDFCAFQRMILELNDVSQKCYLLSSDSIKFSEMLNIAEDEQKEFQNHAQALLMQVFKYAYPELRLLPIEENSTRFSQATDSTWSESEDNNFIFQLFPNPASDNVTLLFKSVENSKVASIYIHDVNGKLIETFRMGANTLQNFSTENLTNSLYFATLYVDGKAIKQQKLVLVK